LTIRRKPIMLTAAFTAATGIAVPVGVLSQQGQPRLLSPAQRHPAPRARHSTEPSRLRRLPR
jgi:hypothetical protein